MLVIWAHPGRQPVRTPLLERIVRHLASHKSVAARAVLKGFLDEPDRMLVVRTIQVIGSPNAKVDVAADLIRLAEGKDKFIAMAALVHLPNWAGSDKHRAKIAAALERLHHHPDAEVALQAAIISGSFGDSELAFPHVLKAAKSPNHTVAMKAIVHLGTPRYQGRGREVIPVLVGRLKTKHGPLLEQVIRILGQFPGCAKHVMPFLDHRNRYVVRRAIIAVHSRGAREAIPALEKLVATSTDRIAILYAKDALKSLRRPKPK